MPKQEVHELHEHAHEAALNPQLFPVTITMSILAVFIAVTSLFGHRSITEEIMAQNKATDQWAYYQAKSIRKHSNEQFADLLNVIDAKDKALIDKLKESYKKESEKYDSEQKEIEADARKLEDETGVQHKKGDRFDFGELLLEAALVITSMTLLTKWRTFWFAGMLIGLVGIVIGISGFLVH